MPKNIYQEHGFPDREAYLRSLAENSGLPYQTIRDLATVMGKSEDFDGLISEIMDLTDNEIFSEMFEAADYE